MTWRLPENPFVGLRPFETEETLLFFGRQEQTRDLLQQLHETRLLAVIGSSGCGKSSLIRAGLIPRLLGGFLVEDRDAWLVARMKPGEDPILNLARELHLAASGNEDPTDVASIVETIHEQGLEGVLDYLAPLMRPSEANLLLLVDQFEEIFRFKVFSRTHQDLEEAAQFVAIMLGLSEQRKLPIYVTMTMRSDYLGDCDAFMGLPEALNRSQYLVPRLTRQQRREAIEGPVRLYQGQISDRLVDRLLNETGEARDDLPILQHALMRTWSFAHASGGTTKDGTLDLAHYETIGTVKGALSQHAEEALMGMDPRFRSLAKRLFQALTEVDPGNRRIRRPVKLNQVAAVTGADPEELWPLIQKFREEGRSFLVLSSENLADDPLIDISHESLIRQWERLNRWVDEEVESAEVYQRLARTARLHGKGETGFYRDPALQIAVNWRETKHPNPAWARRYDKEDEDFEMALDFLRQSEAESEKERAEREAAQKREQELEAFKALAALEKQRAEEQTLAATKLRRRALYLTVAMILAIAASIFAFWQTFSLSNAVQDVTQQANIATKAEGGATAAQGTATAAQGIATAAQVTATAAAQGTATAAQGTATAAQGIAAAGEETATAAVQGTATAAQGTAETDLELANLLATNEQLQKTLVAGAETDPTVIIKLVQTQEANQNLIAAIQTSTPTNTPAPTPTPTRTETQAPTETPIPGITPTSTLTHTPTPTPFFTRDGADIIQIPAGKFQMGSDPDIDPYFAGAEFPVHTVSLNAYWIYKSEVTNGMFGKCVAEGGCDEPLVLSSITRSEYYGNDDFADYPVVFVSWNDAKAYCAWAGGRLPTEAEWEKAARGDQDTRLFPWGDDPPTGAQANYCDLNCPTTPRDSTQDDGYIDTAPVGSFPEGASPSGALDMAGNVREWTQDWFDPVYYSSSPAVNPAGPLNGDRKVTRGGSFIDARDGIRTVFRRSEVPEKTTGYIGFRCAVDVLD